MSYEDYGAAHYSEDLLYTLRGEWVLEIQGKRDYTKQLTPMQAEKWLNKRYPGLSWNRLNREAEGWLKLQQKKANKVG